MYKVILWHVHATIAAIETQQCIPFLLLIYVCQSQSQNEINIESTAMETQLCILCIAPLYVAAKNMKLN